MNLFFAGNGSDKTRQCKTNLTLQPVMALDEEAQEAGNGASFTRQYNVSDLTFSLLITE